MITNKTLLPLSVLFSILLLVLFVYWLTDGSSVKPQARQSNADVPDVQIKNLSMSLLLKDDSRYLLEANQLSNVNGRRSELRQPDLRFTNEQGEWILRADHGVLEGKQKIALTGHVVVQQKGSSERRLLKAARADIDLERQQLLANGEVKLTMQGLALSAASLSLDLKANILRLQGDVRGEYAFP